MVAILAIEVGSTITKANGFRRTREGAFELLAQGFAPTSVATGDVGVGVDEAIADLRATSGLEVGDAEVHLNSSAAGGLRMTVHGLTYGMTARAAREAALGAGAIVELVTVGDLSDSDLDEMRSIRPNLVLLAGGVDFGEQGPILRNAERLATLDLNVPVLYAGNAAIREQVRKTLESAGVETVLTDNVFPEVDVLNIEPVRHVIHEAFNRHIVHAPGMERLGELTQGASSPRPARCCAAPSCSPRRSATALSSTSAAPPPTSTLSLTGALSGSPRWRSPSPEPSARSRGTSASTSTPAASSSSPAIRSGSRG